MKSNLLLIAAAMISVLFLTAVVFAGGMGGGGMGNRGPGMMGGGHMMDDGRGYPIPYMDQYNRYSRPEESYRYGPTKTERLRQEIHEKRQELGRLYVSEKPDKDLIQKKINELARLEAELDHKLSGP